MACTAIPTAYFYPRSPCGERQVNPRCPKAAPNFYPRSPCGERPYGALKHVHETEISIHALLAESDERADSLAHAPPQISIHALLAESDRDNGRILSAKYLISIHALLAESDNFCAVSIILQMTFLSTLSLRRAT